MNALPVPAPLPAPSSVPVCRLSSPGDVVTMIPYVLGFVPAESVVLAALEGPRRRFGVVMRCDLLSDRGLVAAQVQQVMSFVTEQQVGDALVVAYSADGRAADRTMRPLLRALRGHGTTVHEAIRADGSRWYSYLCRKSCCPVVGTPYDLDTSRPAAEAVVAGLTRAESRDQLGEQFRPASAEPRAAVADACERVRAGSSGEPLEGPALHALLLSAQQPDADHATRVAILLVALQDERTSVAALMLMTRTDARLHFEAWREVMRLAPIALMPAAGALCAFAAWLDGHGVLASHALECVEAIAPEQPLAVLVHGLLDRAVPPTVWEEVMSAETDG